MSQLLTNSRMRTFRECARKHDLAYVQGWRPAVEPEALRFGSLMHRGIEGYRREGASLIAALEAVAGRAADAFEQVRAEELLRGYSARWSWEDKENYEVVAVEVQFEMPLLNPETFAASRVWRFAGKIDGILKDVATGRMMVTELKTTSEPFADDAADYWLALSMNSQVSAYILGAESLGYSVEDTLYDVIGKVKQRQLKATPIEDRKFTKDGRLYASMREHDETPEEYRERVRAAIIENPARYFQRRLIPRTESQIKDWMFDVWQQAQTMRESERLGRSPRNGDSCLAWGRCVYFDLCSTGAKPEGSSDFVKIENVHQELTLPKEESK